MSTFLQITAARREQRRAEKRMREQVMAAYRYQMKLAQVSMDAMRSLQAVMLPMDDGGEWDPAAAAQGIGPNKLN